jgi:hypothetical protein
MTALFDSIGTVVTGFNTTITPLAPAGLAAGKLLVVAFWEDAGSDAPPDLSAFGFTRKSLNSAVTACVQYTKIAVGGDTMPSAQFGAGWAGCVCACYTGATETLDRTASERGTNSTSGLNIPGASAGPSNGDIVIVIACRNNGSATGVTISNYGSFIQRATSIPNASGRPLACFEDWIQTTPAAVTLGAQATSPADSVTQTTSCSMIFLQASAPAIVPFPPTSLGGMNVQVCQ